MSSHFKSVTHICLCLIIFSYIVTPIHTYDECSVEAIVDRTLDEIGFHRNIGYSFSLTSNCSIDFCKFCLQEFIPSGLYVNPDQLNELHRFGKLSASVVDNVDIEASAAASQILVVRIFKQLQSSGGRFSSKASLPVHARYHDPQPGGGFRIVNLTEPELYMYCPELPFNSVGGLYLTECTSSETLPLPYRKVPFHMSEGERLWLEVPVGDTDSLGLVFAGTFGVVIAGTGYLIGVLYKI